MMAKPASRALISIASSSPREQRMPGERAGMLSAEHYSLCSSPKPEQFMYLERRGLLISRTVDTT